MQRAESKESDMSESAKSSQWDSGESVQPDISPEPSCFHNLNREFEIVSSRKASDDQDIYPYFLDACPDINESGRSNSDMQGIQWPSAKIRHLQVEARFQDRRPFHNVVANHFGALEKLRSEYNQVYKPIEEEMFRFYRFCVGANPCYYHFQLRNMLGSATASEYYYIDHLDGNHRLIQFNAASRKCLEVLNPMEDERRCVRRYSDVQFCTLVVKNDLISLGGINGQIFSYSLRTEGVTSTEVVQEPHFESNIVNGLTVSDIDPSQPKLIASTNCNSVKVYQQEDLSLCSEVELDWPANFACMHPTNPGMLAIAGDSCACLLYDIQADQVITELEGHMDFNFAVAWHPEGQQFVTGSQDKTMRVWDVRNMSKSLDVIPCKHSEVRSLQYSPDGKYLAVAEPQDVVTIYNAEFTKKQCLSFFGDVAGATFSPDSSTLMVAVQDWRHGGLLELNVKEGRLERAMAPPVVDPLF